MDDIKKYMDIVQANSINPKQSVVEELHQLDEGVAKGLLILIGKIIGSVFRLAQLGFLLLEAVVDLLLVACVD